MIRPKYRPLCNVTIYFVVIITCFSLRELVGRDNNACTS